MSKLGFIFLLWGILTRFSYGSKGTQRCASNQWQCADTSCIFLLGLCDNFPDCPDESDEKGCNSVVCNEGQRPCSSGECIDEKKFCDGVIHCKDAGDELAADCRGVILTTTQISTVKKETVFANTHAPLPVPLTFTANKSFLTTRPPWEPNYTTNEISRQNKETPYLPTTTSTQNQVTLPKWILKFVSTKAPDKPTKREQHPPIIIVPFHMNKHSQTPIQWLDLFKTATQKNNNHLMLSTPVPETTPILTRGQSSPEITKPFWYDVHNSTYQPTTSKTPCVLVPDQFEFCRRRYRGYYRHPDTCKQYIVCEWGDMHVCTCPIDTHWDFRILSCIWDYASPCITGEDDKLIVPDQPTPIPTLSLITWEPTTPSSTTITKVIEVPTSTPRFTTTEFIPPPVRLRGLPATPAWLKELTERKFLRRGEQPAPRYQSLLTRFFKAVPREGIDSNIRINK